MNVPFQPALPLSCTVVTDAAELERLREDWRALLARSASNEGMLTPEWLLTWWRVFGPQDHRQLRALLFRDETGRLVGLAPLLRRRYWYFPGIPFRRLEPLGAGEREEDAICSDYLNAIAERGFEAAVADAFARALAEDRAGAWDELVLPMMAGDGPMPALLVAALRRAGYRAEQTTTGEAPYIALPPTWGAYLKSLDKKNRYNITRSLRDFEEWSAGEWALERATTPADLERGKKALIGLHRQRWEGEGEVGTFRSPHFLAFHDQVMPLLLDRGELDLIWLSVRGKPVAATYSIVHDGKVCFYQCGRRLDVPKGVRPGGVLLAHAIRVAIEAGRREFDFLGGAALYKMQLTRTTRPLVQVRAARGSLVEHARRLVERGRAGARALKRGLRAALKGRGPSPELLLPLKQARS